MGEMGPGWVSGSANHEPGFMEVSGWSWKVLRDGRMDGQEVGHTIRHRSRPRVPEPLLPSNARKHPQNQRRQSPSHCPQLALPTQSRGRARCHGEGSPARHGNGRDVPPETPRSQECGTPGQQNTAARSIRSQFISLIGWSWEGRRRPPNRRGDRGIPSCQDGAFEVSDPKRGPCCLHSTLPAPDGTLPAPEGTLSALNGTCLHQMAPCRHRRAHCPHRTAPCPHWMARCPHWMAPRRHRMARCLRHRRSTGTGRHQDEERRAAEDTSLCSPRTFVLAGKTHPTPCRDRSSRGWAGAALLPLMAEPRPPGPGQLGLLTPPEPVHQQLPAHTQRLAHACAKPCRSLPERGGLFQPRVMSGDQSKPAPGWQRDRATPWRAGDSYGGVSGHPGGGWPGCRQQVPLPLGWGGMGWGGTGWDVGGYIQLRNS